MRPQSLGKETTLIGTPKRMGSFGVSKKDGAYIMHILRNQIYTDKILAVVREYMCNAVDAHLEAGNERPFDVHLPTKFDLDFRVRDYGKGLSEEGVFELFTQYGASSKRESNDVTGMLGIGCKSGFAYADAFQVISYFDGKRTVYSAFIDKSGLGAMLEVSCTETDQPTGVEIIIPVNSKDVDAFVNRCGIIGPYLAIVPNVLRVNLQLKVQYSLVGKGWAKRERKNTSQDFSNSQGYSNAVMGGIPYRINWDSFTDKDAWARNEDTDPNSIRMTARHKTVLDSGLDIFFEMGDLDFSASREGLEYTTRTQKAIRTRISEIIEDIHINIREKIEQAPSYREACAIYHACMTEWRSILPKEEEKFATYKDGREVYSALYPGVMHLPPVDGKSQTVKTATLYSARKYHARSKSTRGLDPRAMWRAVGDEKYNRVGVNPTQVSSPIFIVDPPIARGWKDRMAVWAEQQVERKKKTNQHAGSLIVIVPNYGTPIDNDTVFKLAWKEFDLDHFDNVIKGSRVTPPTKQTKMSVTYAKDKRKHNKRCFAFKWNDAQINKHSVAHSNYWSVEDIPQEGAIVYVPIDAFRVVDLNYENGIRRDTGEYFAKVRDLFSFLDIDTEKIRVFGFKKGVLEKMPQEDIERIKHLPDYIKERAAEKEKESNLISRSFECDELYNITMLGFEDDVVCDAAQDLPEDHLFRNLVDLSRQMVEDSKLLRKHAQELVHYLTWYKMELWEGPTCRYSFGDIRRRLYHHYPLIYSVTRDPVEEHGWGLTNIFRYRYPTYVPEKKEHEWESKMTDKALCAKFIVDYIKAMDAMKNEYPKFEQRSKVLWLKPETQNGQSKSQEAQS